MPSNIDFQTKSSPTVGIVISCYNYGRYLAEAIESVLSQTYSSWQLVIVDDGSTDNSLEIAKHYQSHPQIKIIAQANQGVVAARNNGLDALESVDYVCFVDADDVLTPTYINQLVNALDNSDKTTAFAYGGTIELEQKQIYNPPISWDRHRLLHTNYIPVSAVVRAEVLVEVGGFSDYMNGRYGFEDWELWLKLVQRGYRGVLVSDAFYLYRNHGSGRNKVGLSHYKEQVDRLKKHHPQLYAGPTIKLRLLGYRLLDKATTMKRKVAR